jgi:hypothetical protein
MKTLLRQNNEKINRKGRKVREEREKRREIEKFIYPSKLMR